MKKNHSMPGTGQIVKVAKDASKRKLRVTLFPDGGGSPVEVDVEPDEKGVFKVRDALTFKVAPGSVWMGRDGVMRAIAHEGNPQTISLSALRGDAGFHPMMLHEVAENNRIAQAHMIAKSNSMWRTAGTWAIVLVGLGIILGLFLVMKSISDGTEAIRATLDTIQISSGGGTGQTAAEAAGHNNIAPGGR